MRLSSSSYAKLTSCTISNSSAGEVRAPPVESRVSAGMGWHCEACLGLQEGGTISLSYSLATVVTCTIGNSSAGKVRQPPVLDRRGLAW